MCDEVKEEFLLLKDAKDEKILTRFWISSIVFLFFYQFLRSNIQSVFSQSYMHILIFWGGTKCRFIKVILYSLHKCFYLFIIKIIGSG